MLFRSRDALKKDSRGLSRGRRETLAPGSQALSGGEAKDSALLSSRDAGLLEPPERPQGPRPRELRAFFSCMAWRAIPQLSLATRMEDGFRTDFL